MLHRHCGFGFQWFWTWFCGFWHILLWFCGFCYPPMPPSVRVWKINADHWTFGRSHFTGFDDYMYTFCFLKETELQDVQYLVTNPALDLFVWVLSSCLINSSMPLRIRFCSTDSTHRKLLWRSSPGRQVFSTHLIQYNQVPYWNH